MAKDKKKKYEHTSESQPQNKYYITIGSLFALGFSFYLISEGKAWISLIISAFVTWVCFALAARNKKNGLFIFLGVLAIIFDILNVIATAQLIF